jgi:hypothetical protein
MNRGPSIKGLVDDRVEQSIRRLYDEIAALKSKPSPDPPLPPSSEEIRQSLQSSGEASLQVDQLLGRLAQPQLPYVPSGSSYPDLNDPQSQDGSLFYRDDIGQLSRFSASTEPGSWVGATGGSVNVTEVSVSANVTTDQNLMSLAIPAGFLNVVKKTLRIRCYGLWTAASSLDITNKIKLGSLTLLSWTTPSVDIKTDFPWNIEATVVTAVAGTSGTFEAHGMVHLTKTGTGGGDASRSALDTNTATVGTLDLTAAQTLQVTIAFSVGSASNVGKQRVLLVEALN